MLIQDCYKEKGYGTAVERTVLEYGFKELGLSIIYADVVLRNTRSQHVLEKIGFEYLHEDNFFNTIKIPQNQDCKKSCVFGKSCHC